MHLSRETLETPDGDDLAVDRLEGPAGAPTLVVLHGLEGSSLSAYVQGLLRQARSRGWRGAAMNFRSCARLPSGRGSLPTRRPRLYHSGETSDLDFLLRALREREPAGLFLAAGVSLGGNVLLKWLGEHPGQDLVARAASISAPYDLLAGARHLERGLGRPYAAGLLATLRRKAADVAMRFPEAAKRIDVEAAAAARTFWEFDEAATAPLHGFDGADDYYARSSCLGFLSRVTTPTLCISAMDDPFLPAEAVSKARQAASAAVRFAVTRRGGHVGFVSGAAPWRARYWAEEAAVDWLAEAAR
ncbi:MAG TPA: alpha/beta fold hydrolase [Thermoanaerobaculia bacterium]|nr:alpha/beta fold hydrolase [Thermoanaerobaculia bacterium]